MLNLTIQQKLQTSYETLFKINEGYDYQNKKFRDPLAPKIREV